MFLVFCVVFLVRSVLLMFLVFCVVFLVGSVLLIFLDFCVVFFILFVFVSCLVCPMLLISLYILEIIYPACTIGGRRGHDRMIVGFATTYAISAYHH